MYHKFLVYTAPATNVYRRPFDISSGLGAPFIASLNGRFYLEMIYKHVDGFTLEVMLVRMTSFADSPPG